MHPKLTAYVSRKPKKAAKLLRAVMAILAVLFLLGGIVITRGLFLPCFLMAGLYFLYDLLSRRDYEYIYENNLLQIDLIRGRQIRSTEHVLDLQNLEVVAPHDHEAVAAYRKGGEKGSLSKYDYTSYDDTIPYYTMIVYEDRKPVKLLLDLPDSFLAQMKRDYPDKVYRQKDGMGSRS